MEAARMTLDPTYRAGEIDPRLWGSLVEHVGRCVYGGLYEPDHPTADDLGFRGDLLAEVRELGIPLIRYPGGCFVSGYEWEYGIGPRAQRQPVLDLAWRVTEPNLVGVDDFCEWCQRAGTQPFLVVNLGTRGLEAARALIEYCNHPAGSPWSDRRVANGYSAPHAVKVWGLGNEPDTNFELGGKTADEYGRLARETARIMRRVDPTIELVACGSAGPHLSSFPAYDATVLEHVYDVVDHVAVHAYFGNPDDDIATYLASTVRMEWFIQGTIAAIDYVRTKLRSPRALSISFDEWNVTWYHSAEADRAIPPWVVAPPFMEDVFTFEDALMFGCMGITLLQHADRIKIGGQSTLVNNVGLFLTSNGGPLWRQTIYYPFRHLSRFGQGVTLHTAPRSPRYDNPTFGDVPYLHATATWDEARAEVTIFAVNRAVAEPLPLIVDARGFPDYDVVEHLVLAHGDRKARNTRSSPETVQPHAEGNAYQDAGEIHARLAPLSWNVIRLQRRVER